MIRKLVIIVLVSVGVLALVYFGTDWIDEGMDKAIDIYRKFMSNIPGVFNGLLENVKGFLNQVGIYI